MNLLCGADLLSLQIRLPARATLFALFDLSRDLKLLPVIKKGANMPPKRPPPLVPKKPNPSLNYEVLIYLNSFYFGMFACCEMAMGLLKAINLSYTGHTLALDTGVMISFIAFETIRLIMGRMSSLAGRGWSAILSVFMIFPCFLVVSYLLLVQTYRLRLEYCLCTLQIALYITEVWYAILFVFSLCRPVTYD